MMYMRWRMAQLGALTVAFRYAWRGTWRIGIGDRVDTIGRKLVIRSGVSAPMWDVQDVATGEELRCHESDMRRVRSLSGYAHSFGNGWRFFMGCWFDIEVGRRLGFRGAYYGTDGYLRRRQRRFDRRYVRDAAKRAAQRSASGV